MTKKNFCQKYGAKFNNVPQISKEAEYDRELIARDNIHPWGLVYRKCGQIYNDVAEIYVV